MLKNCGKWNHIDIKLIINKARKNYLVSEPNFHTTIFFSKNLLAIEMKKSTNIKKKQKTAYLRPPILEIAKIAI